MEANQAGGLSAQMPSHSMIRRSKGPIELQQQITAADVASNTNPAVNATTTVVHIPILPSLGLLDDASRFPLNPPDHYVRFPNQGKSYNVNASYLTVMRDQRVHLVKTVSSLLGNNPDMWYSIRPERLPRHPLDWSTVLLKEMHKLAASMPSSLKVLQRIAAVNQVMLSASYQKREDASGKMLAGLNSAVVQQHAKAAAREAVEGVQTEYQQMKDEKKACEEELNRMRETVMGLALEIEFKEQNWEGERRAWAREKCELEKQVAAFEEANAWLEFKIVHLQVESAGKRLSCMGLQAASDRNPKTNELRS